MSKLDQLGDNYRAAKDWERAKLEQLRVEVRKQAEAGMPEAELASRSGLNRGTVRRMLGRPVSGWNPTTDEPAIETRGPRARARLGMAAELPRETR